MELSAIALQGLGKAERQFEKAAGQVIGASVPATSPDGTPVDVVDLSTAMVSLLFAKDAFKVNVEVLKTAEEMERETINLMG